MNPNHPNEFRFFFFFFNSPELQTEGFIVYICMSGGQHG